MRACTYVYQIHQQAQGPGKDMCDLQVHGAFARSKCGCSKSEDAFQIFPISIHDSRCLDRFSVEKPCSQEQGVSKNNGTPKSFILIGFSIIFTIHFGGFSPYFWVDAHRVPDNRISLHRHDVSPGLGRCHQSRPGRS